MKKPIFWEWSDGKATYFNSYKLVSEGKDNPWELYNLKSDPTETKNLAKEKFQLIQESYEYLNKNYE